MPQKAIVLLGHVPHAVFSIFLMLWLDQVIYWDFWAVFIPIWIEIGALLVLLCIRVCSWSNRGQSQSSTMLAILLVIFSLSTFSIFLCLRLQETIMWNWIQVASPLYVLGIGSLFAAILKPRGTKFVGMALFGVPIAVLALLVTLRMEGLLSCSWFVVFIPAWALYGILVILILAMSCVLATGPINSSVPVFGSASCTSLVLSLITIIPAFIFTLFLCMKLAGVISWQWYASTLLYLTDRYQGYIYLFLCMHSRFLAV